MERTLWAAMKSLHSPGTAGRPDAEIEQTFFNSVTRRVFATVGVDDAIEYVEPARRPARTPGVAPPLYDTYTGPTADAALVRAILDAIPWSVPYAEPERDAGIVAELIRAALHDVPAAGPVAVDVVRSVFYRNKGAYVVGRVRRGEVHAPARHPAAPRRARHRGRCGAADPEPGERGIRLQLVILPGRGAPPARPRRVPPVDHAVQARSTSCTTPSASTSTARPSCSGNLMSHLQDPDARFDVRRGRRGNGDGGVHASRLQPGLQDHQGQLRRAQEHHAPGRDGQVPLRVRARPGGPAGGRAGVRAPRVPPPLLSRRAPRLSARGGGNHRPRRGRPGGGAARLHRAAGHAAQHLPAGCGGRRRARRGARVWQRHQGSRRGRHLHRRHAAQEFRRDAERADHLLRLRRALPALASAASAAYRRLRSIEEEFAAEPWFHVGENDIFPEEFQAFLAPPGGVRDAFLAAHGDLLDIEFWHGVQQRLERGEVVDVFPYPRNALLQRRD